MGSQVIDKQFQGKGTLKQLRKEILTNRQTLYSFLGLYYHNFLNLGVVQYKRDKTSHSLVGSFQRALLHNWRQRTRARSLIPFFYLQRKTDILREFMTKTPRRWTISKTLFKFLTKQPWKSQIRRTTKKKPANKKEISFYTHSTLVLRKSPLRSVTSPQVCDYWTMPLELDLN